MAQMDFKAIDLTYEYEILIEFLLGSTELIPNLKQPFRNECFSQFPLLSLVEFSSVYLLYDPRKTHRNKNFDLIFESDFRILDSFLFCTHFSESKSRR